MTAGASRAAPMIAPQPALAPSPQPRPAPTTRALPPGLVEQRGQNWTPIGGQICTPIDTINFRFRSADGFYPAFGTGSFDYGLDFTNRALNLAQPLSLAGQNRNRQRLYFG